MRFFHSAGNVYHREHNKYEGLNRAQQKRQKHYDRGYEERENILIERGDDEFFGEDIAEEPDAE